MRNSVKKALTEGLKKGEIDRYGEMTKSYSVATNLINDIEKSLSLGKGRTDDQVLRKLMISMKDDDDLRKELVNELSKSSGKDIEAQISGLMFQTPFTKKGGVILGAGEIAVSLLSGHPMFALLALSSSPRAVGEFVYRLGKISRVTKMVPKEAAQQLGVGIQQALRKMMKEQNQEQPEQRAEGGNTDMKQPYLVGEEGKELMVPKEDGYILPNNITEELEKKKGESLKSYNARLKELASHLAVHAHANEKGQPQPKAEGGTVGYANGGEVPPKSTQLSPEDNSWLNVIASGVLNAPRSGIQNAKNVYGLARHISEGGLVNDVANLIKHPESRTQLIDYYKNRYGSVDNLKRTIMTDPVGFALDAYTTATGVSSAVRSLAKGVEVGAKGAFNSFNDLASEIEKDNIKAESEAILARVHGDKEAEIMHNKNIIKNKSAISDLKNLAQKAGDIFEHSRDLGYNLSSKGKYAIPDPAKSIGRSMKNYGEEQAQMARENVGHVNKFFDEYEGRLGQRMNQAQGLGVNVQKHLEGLNDLNSARQNEIEGLKQSEGKYQTLSDVGNAIQKYPITGTATTIRATEEPFTRAEGGEIVSQGTSTSEETPLQKIAKYLGVAPNSYAFPQERQQLEAEPKQEGGTVSPQPSIIKYYASQSKVSNPNEIMEKAIQQAMNAGGMGGMGTLEENPTLLKMLLGRFFDNPNKGGEKLAEVAKAPLETTGKIISDMKEAFNDYRVINSMSDKDKHVMKAILPEFNSLMNKIGHEGEAQPEKLKSILARIKYWRGNKSMSEMLNSAPEVKYKVDALEDALKSKYNIMTGQTKMKGQYGDYGKN